LEESDFFRKNEQDDVRNVAERYIAKSDPYIVMVSTPNAPGGLFQKIEQEPFKTCIYKKVFLDYTYGLNKIYTAEEIDKAKASPSFGREYDLKYLGLIGNVFSQQSIQLCQKVEYSPSKVNPNAKKSIGLDPSFGSSKFGIVATQLVDGKIQVIHADEYDRPNFADMIDKIWTLKQKYGHVTNIYVDAANPEVWQALKREFSERYDEQYIRDQIAAAYAGGDDGDGNKQKAEDDSAAAIADCDDNEVERAGFDCIAIATNDVEIETESPEEEPILSVCKEVNDPTGEVEPNDFVFTITSGPNTIRIEGQPPSDCQPVGDIFPGEYTVTEEEITDSPDPDSTSVEDGCTLVDNDPPTATGVLEAGDTERCVFINNYAAPPP